VIGIIGLLIYWTAQFVIFVLFPAAQKAVLYLYNEPLVGIPIVFVSAAAFLLVWITSNQELRERLGDSLIRIPGVSAVHWHP
jgi:hypothetical protein